MSEILKNIISLLDQKDRKKIKILVAFTFIGALLESFGLAAFIPIIEFVSGESLIGISKYFENLDIISLSNINPIFILVSLLFLIFLIKNFYLAFFFWYESKFVFQAKANLINNLFSNYIFKNYNFHVNNNSSKLISNLTVETDIFGNCLSSLIAIIVESILLIILFGFIFFLNPFVSLVLFSLSFFFLYFFYIMLRKITKKLGGDRVVVDAIRQKTLQQSFNGIKEIIVFDNREYFVRYFGKLIDNIKSFVIKFTFINKLQKILVEMFVIISIIFFIILLVHQGYDHSKITALIGVYLIAIIKIVPSINKTVTAINYLQYASKSLHTLNQEMYIKTQKDKTNEILSEKNKINFNQKINFVNVSFKYSEKNVLEDITFELKKNSFIGLIGESGSGKSTLCNLMLGLYEPSTGQILSDGEDIFKNPKSYQSLIGYVPQSIFLLDDTIKNNIAFGIDEKNILEKNIIETIKYSSLENFVEKLPNKLNQFVGEGGIKISGGEKQRIGIARALYRNPQLLILDEPTTALDRNTEKKIINEIELLKNNTTIFLITHKMENLKNADYIFKIENNKLVKIK